MSVLFLRNSLYSRFFLRQAFLKPFVNHGLLLVFKFLFITLFNAYGIIYHANVVDISYEYCYNNFCNVLNDHGLRRGAQMADRGPGPDRRPFQSGPPSLRTSVQY